MQDCIAHPFVQGLATMPSSCPRCAAAITHLLQHRLPGYGPIPINPDLFFQLEVRPASLDYPHDVTAQLYPSEVPQHELATEQWGAPSDISDVEPEEATGGDRSPSMGDTPSEHEEASMMQLPSPSPDPPSPPTPVPPFHRPPHNPYAPGVRDWATEEWYNQAWETDDTGDVVDVTQQPAPATLPPPIPNQLPPQPEEDPWNEPEPNI